MPGVAIFLQVNLNIRHPLTYAENLVNRCSMLSDRDKHCLLFVSVDYTVDVAQNELNGGKHVDRQALTHNHAVRAKRNAPSAAVVHLLDRNQSNLRKS